MAKANLSAAAVSNGKAAHTAKPRRSRRTKRPKIPYYGRTKSIEELAREQGKVLRPWTREDWEEMKKIGKGLFRSRKELDEFIAGIYERRRQSRGA